MTSQNDPKQNGDVGTSDSNAGSPLSPMPARDSRGGGSSRTSSTLLSVAPQDLSGDRLLVLTAKVDFEGRSVPALGGIPVLAKIGQGGMGAVYFGLHPRLKQEVAVKILPINASEQPESVDRFFREAQMAVRVDSPHVVRVLDVNQEQGLYFLVMEFVAGQSAGAHLREVRRLGRTGIEEPVALDICIAATQGLAAAHAKGVIHRDIKPDNIMIPRHDSALQFTGAKLADLGLARCDELGRSLTGTQTALGTPGYMAPEQATDAKSARKPADVFSMGATLYALLSGMAPFSGSSAIEMIFATVQRPHSPIQQLCPRVSKMSAELLEICLSKEPSKRFADGSALLEALRACRLALGEPDVTQQRAIQQITFLKKAGEVGQPAAPPSGTPAPSVAQALTPPAPLSSTLPPGAGINVAPAAPSKGPAWRSLAAALLIVALFAAGGAGGFFILREHQFASAREEALKGPAPKSIEDHDAAIARLENFKQSNAGRLPGDLAAVTQMIESLRQQRAVLAERKSAFEQLLNKAAQQMPADPAGALATLAQAQMQSPELAALVSPTVEERRKAIEAERKLADERAGQAQERAMLDQFRSAFDAAKKAAEGGEWTGAKLILDKALKDLGERRHPDLAAAMALLEQAQVELKKQGDAVERVGQADQAMDHDPALARKKYEEALTKWPKNPAKDQIELRIADAQRAIEDENYNRQMSAGRAALDNEKWGDARAAFREALKIRADDKTALSGIADADGREKKQRDAAQEAVKKQDFAALMERGTKALQEEKFGDAEAAFNEAKGLGVDETRATTALTDVKTKKESKQRYDSAIAAARAEIDLKHPDLAREAAQKALQERPNDVAALKLMIEVEAIKPVTAVEPPKPAPAAPPPPPAPKYGPAKVYGPFGVYADRIQGVPLDKKGELVPVRTDLDKEQYEAALERRKSWLVVGKGSKVRIEAAGKWYSGPTGAWVTADGKRDDGTESLKNFRAFTGPDNNYNIAMLVVYAGDKDLTELLTKKMRTDEYKKIEQAGLVWAYKGEPIEFVMPASGILRMQQNRDGYFDVTQGALNVTVTVSEPASK